MGAVVDREWDRFVKEEIQKVIDSMPEQIAVIIEVKGGNTKWYSQC